jgi:hypothetical protein
MRKNAIRAKIDFNHVKEHHVKQACREVIKKGFPEKRRGISAFIIFTRHSLPAKYVLGRAYEIATGMPLNSNDYHGGSASTRVLELLGFKIKKSGFKRVGKQQSTPALLRQKSTHRGSRPGKAGLLEALRDRFGEVRKEAGFPWLVVPNRDALPDYLRKVRNELIAHRGYKKFDTPGHKLRCDFFLPDHNVIIEVDERQHFTNARVLALRNYPENSRVGFSRESWIASCESIAAVDPSPPYRDEQRAYYDTLRDLLAQHHGMQPLMRVMAEDLNDKGGVARTIAAVVNGVSSPRMQPSPVSGRSVPIGRVVVRGPANLKPQNAEQLLLEVLKKRWPGKTLVEFLVTPGGFLQHKIDSRQGNRGWASTLNDIKPFIKAAEGVVLQTLTKRVFLAADGKAKFLTIGVDVNVKDGTRAELVSIVDVGKRAVIRWTGKSYPTSYEERTLVQVADLQTHFSILGNQRVMVLGCHDLNMFSPRGEKTQNAKGNRRRRCKKMRALAKRFRPTIVLHHPHTTDTPLIWRQSWASIHKHKLPTVSAWASGICYHNGRKRRRAPLDDVLTGTRSHADPVVDIVISSKEFA